MVLLGRRAQRVIARINSSAKTLRNELLADISTPDLQMCMDVLAHIKDRAEKSDKLRARGERAVARRLAVDNGRTKRGDSILRKRAIRRGSK
jgi:hypothetical protein